MNEGVKEATELVGEFLFAFVNWCRMWIGE